MAGPEAPLETLTLAPAGPASSQALSTPPGKEWIGDLAAGGGNEGIHAERAAGTPRQSPSRSPPLVQALASAGRAQEERPPLAAWLPISTSFLLSASEPGTNAQRVMFITLLLASSSECLLCTATLLNAWCVLSCLFRSPWRRCDLPPFRKSRPRIQGSARRRDLPGVVVLLSPEEDRHPDLTPTPRRFSSHLQFWAGRVRPGGFQSIPFYSTRWLFTDTWTWSSFISLMSSTLYVPGPEDWR